MDYDTYGGSLVKVTGVVSRYELDNGKVSEFWLTDGNGNEAAIFIDGYITSGTTGENTIAEFVKEGNTVTACGFLYKHPEGSSDVSVPVLRVRDCDEIVLGTKKPTTPDNSNTGSNTSQESNTSEGSNTVTTTNTAIQEATKVTAPLTNLPDAETALAAAVENFGLPCEDVTASLDGKILRAALLDKYYGNNSIIMGHLGNAVGFTVETAGLQQTNTDLNLSIEKKELPNFAPGFHTVQLTSSEETKLATRIGIHTHVGTEYVGKAAYLFRKSLDTGAYVLDKVMFVNEIGNVALTTDEMTDYMILIAE